MKTAEFEPMTAQEQLSALHDGQLNAQMAAALVRQSLNDDSLMHQWRSMSVIGMAIGQRQTPALSNPGNPSNPSHPSIAAQGAAAAQSSQDAAAAQSLQDLAAAQSLQVPRAEAANDSLWRWKMVAGFAAVAAVGSLSWGLLGHVGAADQIAALKQTQNLSAANGAAQTLLVVNEQAAGQEVAGREVAGREVTGLQAVMIRDPRLDELMAAHKQFGGNSALHQSAGSLRSVSLGGARP